jgi:tetratricopeptide (TPR) repeat protein
MADIFISYTHSDRDWAFWIGTELEAQGHTPRIHEWELPAGGDIISWMEERQGGADRTLCIVSKAYLKQPYSNLERRAAQWAAAANRQNFIIPIFIEACEAPMLFAHLKRCDLHGVSEDEARRRLAGFLAPTTKPKGPMAFPSTFKPGVETPKATTFPGRCYALTNVPIMVPLHFLGRGETLVAIQDALQHAEGRVAITALHGLRGVGKSTLAAAYAERHRAEYRATWWIRAQTEVTMRADLVALGVRLHWVVADDKEESALAAVMEYLRHESRDILLIYDNATDVNALKPYLPPGSAAHVLVTSNAHAWRGIAQPVEIRLWPKEIGADYLIARTGRVSERGTALMLSEALGGLPLAHEQAAAYCERLEISLDSYRRRFERAPALLLDDAQHAPAEYHDGMTVAKTFTLAIEEAAKLHPGAEPLITYAAILAPEPIPLFLFSEAREQFGEPLASALAGDGLDKAVAALRNFALVDRENIADEFEPAITTDTIRLHRLVRQVAGARCAGEARAEAQQILMEALAAVYPLESSFHDRVTRLRSRERERRLREIIYALSEVAIGDRPDANTGLRPLVARALTLAEKQLGPDNPDLATSLNNLAHLLQESDDLRQARFVFERALAIRKRVFGDDHEKTNRVRRNLARVLLRSGDPKEAVGLAETALAAHDKALGPHHVWTKDSARVAADALAALGRAEEAIALRERYAIAASAE